MLIKLFHLRKERRKRGITHMHNTNDDILINYRPNSLQEDNYIADIEAIIENGAYHSDEVSETDDEKTQDEVSRHIRPKNKNESDHHALVEIIQFGYKSDVRFVSDLRKISSRISDWKLDLNGSQSEPIGKNYQ